MLFKNDQNYRFIKIGSSLSFAAFIKVLQYFFSLGPLEVRTIQKKALAQLHRVCLSVISIFMYDNLSNG